MSLPTRPAGSNAGLRAVGGLGLRSGGAYYPPESVSTGKFFVSEIVDYSEVRISIDKTQVPAHPTAGAWLELCLTRNPQGDPVTNLDGLALAKYPTTAVTGWQTYRDTTGLLPGRWIHYGLFARYSFAGDMQWHRIATTSELLPDVHRYNDRLFTKLPRWYQEQDDDSPEHLVRNLYDGIGFATDINRTWIETLQDVWNAERTPAHLLQYLSGLLGQPYERSVGDARVRKLLSNLVYLRKMKGTKEAIEGFVSALSGYRVLAHQSLNLMLTVEDGEFRTGVGNWVADASTSTSRTSSVAVGAPPSPLGLLRIQRSSGTGQAGAFSTPTALQGVAIDPGVARQFAVSFNGRTSTGTFNAFVRLDWYTSARTFISSTTSAGLACTTAHGRKLTAWLTAPDTARYVRILVYTASIVSPAALEIGQVMLVDRRWRPEGMPGAAASEPFSEPGAVRYTGVDFYDAPRTPWVNVYPNRTNFAVNSNFSLNNLPAGGWSVVDAPTYASLPFAYATYTLVSSTETDYDDLAEGFDSVTPTWTISFDTANKRLALISSPSGPYLAQVRSRQWPVIEGAPYSAALEMASNVVGSVASLRIQWFTIDDVNAPLLVDGVPAVTDGGTFNLAVGTNTRVDIRNAIVPEGAGWARLVVEVANTVAFTAYAQQALIEDAAVPGSYFDGSSYEGASGDFDFIGVDFQTASVYYLNYDVMLGSTSNRVLTATTEMLPMHVNQPRITTAYNGLYDELA